MFTKVAVTLSPKISNGIPPEVLVSVPGQIARATLNKTQQFEFAFNETWGFLQVTFTNKPELDQDMAVIIDQVEFFGISDPKFIWQGVYTPIYPEPWASQQQSLAKELVGQTYMGWNGTWRLDFTLPVFTWMHKTLDLGWIYQ